MKRTLKRESKELEIVWRVTVFEQCGWKLLLSFARSLVSNLRYPVRVNFVWAKVRLERYHVKMGYSPAGFLVCMGLRNKKGAFTFIVSLPQDMNEMLKITPS